MTEIKLSRIYYIRGERHQWVLLKRTAASTKELGYYVKLENLLQDYISMRCRTAKGIKTIEEIRDYQKTLLNQLSSVLAQFDIEIVLKNDKED